MCIQPRLQLRPSNAPRSVGAKCAVLFCLSIDDSMAHGLGDQEF